VSAANVGRDGVTMPLQDYEQILTVDDHLIESSRVFIDRLPSKHSAKLPCIVEINTRKLFHFGPTGELVDL
jgi:hypothetical protein